MNMSAYDKNALAQIHEWKTPSLSRLDKAMSYINYPLEKGFDALHNVPGIEWVLRKSFGGIFTFLNDFAHWSIRPSAICQEYRENGFNLIQQPSDIYSLNLKDVDKVVGFLAAKYKALAGGEGLCCGLIGALGIPTDALSLVTLNLRAIGEYATYYGFDISSQEERLYALNVLELTSSPSNASKQIAMAQLVKISTDVAKKATWKQLEENAFVQVVQAISKSLGIRLTKAKLADVIPVISAIIGGGFNLYYTNRVCDSAFFLYRERFLAQKYGPEVIEITVQPAKDYVTNYGDDDFKDLQFE